jgi:hypothetical protein
MTQQDFDIWFEDVKKCAIEDFGYTEIEVSNFSIKNWKPYFAQDLTAFEAMVQYLKKIFKHHHGH